jgi:hypothetical protein
VEGRGHRIWLPGCARPPGEVAAIGTSGASVVAVAAVGPPVVEAAGIRDLISYAYTSCLIGTQLPGLTSCLITYAYVATGTRKLLDYIHVRRDSVSCFVTYAATRATGTRDDALVHKKGGNRRIENETSVL